MISATLPTASSCCSSATRWKSSWTLATSTMSSLSRYWNNHGGTGSHHNFGRNCNISASWGLSGSIAPPFRPVDPHSGEPHPVTSAQAKERADGPDTEGNFGGGCLQG